MFSTNDFILKYEAYTDEELIDIHANITSYGSQAQEALAIVIKNKGGLEKLLSRLGDKKIIANEIERIANDTVEFGSKGVDVSFIKTVTKSTILSPEKVSEIIDNKYAEVESELEDKKIKPRTIMGSLIGGVIASLLGGTLWGLQMIYSHRIFYIFFAGLVILCYGIIKICTKQTKKNTVVIIATIISIMLALALGQLLYSVIGYKD